MIKSSENISGLLVSSNDQSYKVPSAFLHCQVIGKYKDADIYDKIVDNHGQIWLYDGVTSSPSICCPGIIIVKPGIIYKIIN